MANRITAFITKTLVVVMTSCALFSFAAQARDEDSGLLSMKKPNMFTSEYKPYIGILAGMTSPEGEGDDEGEVGIDLGFSPTKENFMLGLEYGHAEFDDVAADDTIDRDTVLLKAGYKFNSDNMFVRNSWVALGVGALFTDDDTVGVAAPIVGFDIPVTNTETEYLTLGLNARYNFVEADEVDTGNISGAVKYWY
ncbi:hypothetical protein [Pseudobdellovibrio sp. HCB154]|uniref:hypothetical protein n=1 Tax=Pseudobdellovibrio sp. HCB154 TaxID=3386277 RepID=UPI0039174548